MTNNATDGKEPKKPSIEEIMEVTVLARQIQDRHARGEISKDEIKELANKKTPVPVD